MSENRSITVALEATQFISTSHFLQASTLCHFSLLHTWSAQKQLEAPVLRARDYSTVHSTQQAHATFRNLPI